MKRLIAFGLILALLPALLVLPAAATTGTEGTNTVGMEPFAPRQDVTTALRDCVQRIADMAGEARTVAAVKELRDYSDNPYYVCELQPTGYVIADGSYGTIIEYSHSAPSPYQGTNGDLVYLGPTYCYARQDDSNLLNMFSGEVTAGNAVGFAAAAREVSEKLHASQAEYARAKLELNTSEASFNAVGALTEDRSPDTLVGTQFLPRDGATAATTTTYIPGANLLKNLKTAEQLGYLQKGDGVCGYIATGLALYWLDEWYGLDEAINDFAFLKKESWGKSFCGPNLTRELRSYGEYDGSSAIGSVLFWKMEDMCDIIDEYANIHSVNISYEWRSKPGSTFNSVRTALKNNQKPVIMFGRLYDPRIEGNNVTHAVLAYGRTSNDEIIAHYGWANYSEVTINLGVSTFGSSIELTGGDSKAVSISDVSKDPKNWMYASSQYCARYQILKLKDGKYRPNENMTRGDWVWALYTLAGAPTVELEAAYSTLKTYQDAVMATNLQCLPAAAWAVQKGILKGVSSTKLGLEQTLTREQAATFLQRYSNTLVLNYSKTNGPAASSFADYSQLSAYARDPMNFCTKRYLFQGSKESGKLYLKPKAKLTRAEAGQLLYNLSQIASR